ncbi:zinc-dependent alcohol dehydrogenase family protein [Paenibacillus sp. CAU 1782]
MQMKALVFEAPKVAVVKEVAYPEPKPDEVTIKVERTGICGTDHHIFEGEYVSPYPIIPGHEFAGTIHEIGSAVHGFSKGDRVTADPSLYCGSCSYCLTKRTNHCSNWKALGNTVDGSMAEYVAVPARNVVTLPDGLSFQEAAFVEPIACVVHAMNRLQVQAGDRVMLFGAGAMGQQLVQALIRSGASELVISDINREKLDMAVGFGATRGVLANEAAKLLETEAYRNGFDIVIDATGIPAVIAEAFQYMGPTAKYLQFGVASTNAVIELSPFALYQKDWTLLGSMAINGTFLPAFHWVKEKRFDLLPLISKELTLEEAPQYFAGQRNPDWLKVQIKM